MYVLASFNMLNNNIKLGSGQLILNNSFLFPSLVLDAIAGGEFNILESRKAYVVPSRGIYLIVARVILQVLIVYYVMRQIASDNEF